MITAAQAKEKTIEKITQIAKEFILNEVGDAIQEAIKEGKFSTSVEFGKVSNRDKVGARIVELLEADGFKAEYVCYDNVNGYADYIKITWED